jgi:hypothetical protein
MWVEPRTHIVRPTIIEWPGVPNEAMRPALDHLATEDADAKPRFKVANEMAERIYREFKDSIGSKTQFQLERQQRVTAGGLVVYGAPKNNRSQVNAPVAHEGLRVPHREKRGLNILGTVAEPARENMV